MMFTERSFDFSKLDPEASNLYLVVIPSQELNSAICQVAPSVTGAVKSRAGFGAEWIGNETLGGKVARCK